MQHQSTSQWNYSASQNFTRPFQEGEEARRTLDTLLSEHEISGKYDGPKVSGYFEERNSDGQQRFVAFDNTSADCFVEEFDEEWQAALYAGTNLEYDTIQNEAPKARQLSVISLQNGYGDILVSSLEKDVRDHVSQYLKEVGSTASVTDVRLYDPDLLGAELDKTGKQSLHFLVQMDDPEKREREDNVFNGLHEEQITMYGIDINPILPYQSGTIDEYIKKNKDRSIPENMTFQEMRGDIISRALETIKSAASQNGGMIMLEEPITSSYTTISNGDHLEDEVIAVTEDGTFYAIPEGESIEEDYDFEEDPDGIVIMIDSTELSIRSLAEIADSINRDQGSRLQEVHQLIQESINEIASSIEDKTLYPHSSAEFQYDDPDCVSVQYAPIKSMTSEEIEWKNGRKSSLLSLLEYELPSLADSVKEWSKDIRNYSATPRILNPMIREESGMAIADVDGHFQEFQLSRIDLIKYKNQGNPELKENFLLNIVSNELANNNSRTNNIHR